MGGGGASVCVGGGEGAQRRGVAHDKVVFTSVSWFWYLGC